VATLQLVYVAAIHNCYSEVVHWQEIFLLLLCIPEVQWGYHNIIQHDLAEHCLKFWKGIELEEFWIGIKE